MNALALANFVRRCCGNRFPPLGGRISQSVLRRLPSKVECTLFPGIDVPLNLQDLTQQTTYWQGDRFEKPTAQIFAEYGRGASAFFDMGSNYGFFSYWMLHMFPEIQVFAFEPNPRTFELIGRIKDRNGLERMHPQNLGLADARGTLALHPGEEDSGHSTFTDHPGLKAMPLANVDVVPFDEWTSTIQPTLPVDGSWVGKIDVEGFELKVLQGMREHLAKRAFKLLAVEINDYTLNLAGTTPEAVRQFLRENGYVSLRGLPAGKRWPLWKTANDFFIPA